MLNTKKLLYILPDLTYIAELLPGKKDHEYSIQSFRQINGEFIDDNEFIANNVQKLFTKIDKEEYALILPDFLFTNTIVNVEDDSKSGAITYVKEKLLPSLNLSDKTHEIEITVLASFKGSSKVQISAIEKELLNPLRIAAKQSKISIKSISPLSWAIKSIVSLEPSITVLQIGNNLYSSQHYIGIDQTNNFPLDEFKAITETIKTLKGAEPSIQTIYLASSSLIEEKLKKDLGDTLPIQQLATYKEDDSKIPSYIKYIIESCMKTMSIADFPVPKFNLGKASEDDVPKTPSSEEKPKEDKKKETSPTDLPEPSKVPEVVAATKAEETKVAEIADMPTKKEDVKVEEKTKIEAKIDIETKDEPDKQEDVKEKTAEEAKTDDTKEEETKEEINLSQFAGKEDEENKVETESKKDESKTEKEGVEETPNKDDGPTEVLSDTKKTDAKEVNKEKSGKIKSTSKVIKNSSGVNNMLKMVFITLAVFFITIAIGIGVGLGLLKMSDKEPEEANPVVVTEPEATPEATATPEPTVEINKEELSILVVNATTKAGYAGKIKTLLINDDISDVKAGNAEGDYEDGLDYVLMIEENESLKKLLEEAIELDLEFSSDIEAEDSDSDYDAVIVLAK